MRFVAFLAVLGVVTSACGAQVATSTPTPIRTAPVIRTTAPTVVCQGAPSQPSSKATITLDKGGTIFIQLRPDCAAATPAKTESVIISATSRSGSDCDVFIVTTPLR